MGLEYYLILLAIHTLQTDLGFSRLDFFNQRSGLSWALCLHQLPQNYFNYLWNSFFCLQHTSDTKNSLIILISLLLWFHYSFMACRSTLSPLALWLCIQPLVAMPLSVLWLCPPTSSGYVKLLWASPSLLWALLFLSLQESSFLMLSVFFLVSVWIPVNSGLCVFVTIWL